MTRAKAQRTSLDWARDVARSYRSALHAVDPDRCAQLDDIARQRGQLWIAPTEIPAHLVEEALDAVLTAADIAHLWGIPVGTIYSWASRGLLLPANPGAAGPAKYLVRDVIQVESRRKVRRLDSA
jgi:DNA-directed RNA polymerase specialized sigma24 family protein